MSKARSAAFIVPQGGSVEEKGPPASIPLSRRDTFPSTPS